MPFEIPEKWKWVPVNKIIELISGRDLDKSLIEEKATSSSVPYITGASQISSNEVLVNRWTSNGSVFSDNGDLLLTCKGTIGKLAINQIGICHIARQIMAIRPKDQISVDFAKIFFSAIENKLTSNAKSMIPGISRNNVLSLLCPLPPIEEQRRIVQRHNEIILEIDKAESAYNELAGPLSDRLRQLLLERAIQGKLVPQLESEPEVRQLGEVPENVPFAIPEKWKWVKLENLGKWKSGGTPSRSHREYYENGTIPWLKTGDLNDGVIKSVGEYITNSGLENSPAHINPAGSVLIAMYGATIGKVGILQFPCATNQACCACVLKENICDQWYLFYFLLSQRKNFIALGAGGAQPNISRTKIVNSWIPLPPLEEQHRIVAKLNELIGSISQLAQTISTP